MTEILWQTEITSRKIKDKRKDKNSVKCHQGKDTIMKVLKMGSGFTSHIELPILCNLLPRKTQLKPFHY